MLPAFALVWIPCKRAYREIHLQIAGNKPIFVTLALTLSRRRGNPRPETKHEQILRFRDVVPAPCTALYSL